MDWSERIGRRIRLRDLHILLAVVQCKSMAKAAEHLAVSKPVVSKVIADLEHALGVRLLERDRHGAEATIYGAALLKRALIVFDELHQGVKDIETLIDPTAGEVRIGCTLLLAVGFISAVIGRVSKRYPRIQFHLVTSQMEPLRRELTERNVEFVIVRQSSPIADGRLHFEFLFDDYYVVAADAKNPWARRRRITLSELVKESWVLPPPESVPGSVITKAFPGTGLAYPRGIVFAGAEVRMSLLTNGRFLTIVPASALRFPTRRPEIKILPVDLPEPHVPTGILTLKNRALSPVARLFIEHARELAKPLATRKR